MTPSELIRNGNLKPVDAFVLRKRFIGMVDHYVLYMGQRGGVPIFVANYKTGVQEISNEEIYRYLMTLEPIRIEEFKGTDDERKVAFRRALSRVGERAYNYFSNNCEHFKNWVHYGDNYSAQVNNAGDIGLGAGATLTVAGIASENSNVALWGVGLILAGAILKGIDDN